MDELDESILRSLLKNPSKPFLHIAKELGLSSLTVKSRYERMKKDGVFFGSTAILDLSVIGFQGKAFAFIKVAKKSNVKKIIKNLKKIKNLFLVVEIIGSFDLLAMAVFRDVNEMKRIVKEIRSVPYISQIDLSLSDESFYPYRPEYTQIDPFNNENSGTP